MNNAQLLIFDSNAANAVTHLEIGSARTGPIAVVAPSPKPTFGGQRLPASAVTTADVTHHKGALQALGRCEANLGKLQTCWLTAALWASPLRRACRK